MNTKIAIIDYGVGNLFSLKSSFAAIGKEAVLAKSAEELEAAERIILPGVGAFGDAADKLRASGLAGPLMEEARKGKPVLGICLGMQLLFEHGYEYGTHEGLGLIPGDVKTIKDVIAPGTKIPHIGWNELNFTNNSCVLFSRIASGDYVYFVHSYAAFCPEEFVTATTEYGGADLTASVRRGSNIFGCQFHPEKSGAVGLNILRSFCEA